MMFISGNSSSRRLLGIAAAGFLLSGGCTLPAGPDSGSSADTARSSGCEAHRQVRDERSVRARKGSAVLAARFTFDPATGNLDEIAYRIRNTGTEPLMIMDGGTMQGGRYHEAPRILQRTDDAGDISLNIEAAALRDPAPTVPVLAVARRLAPGAALTGVLRSGQVLTDASSARRLRLCLASTRWDAKAFIALPDRPDQWAASFGVAQTQERICTPLVEIAAERIYTCVAGTGPPQPCRIDFGYSGDALVVRFALAGRTLEFVGHRQGPWWSGTLNGIPAAGYELNRGHVVYATADLQIETRFEWWARGNQHGNY